LVIEALDWSSKYLVETKEEIPKTITKKKLKSIPEDYFPPCIKNILQGLSDGRKRSLFVLMNFLKNMGWNLDKIESRIMEWNSKNIPPLRNSYLRTQLRWHFRQERNLLPPNCENEVFYKSIEICKPDEFCTNNSETIMIKNPVNYPFKKMKIRRKRVKKKL
jgi:DNA primase large subunit